VIFEDAKAHLAFEICPLLDRESGVLGPFKLDLAVWRGIELFKHIQNLLVSM
jgi:hypothetical protein